MPYVLILSLFFTLGSCRNSVSKDENHSFNLGTVTEQIKIPSLEEATKENSAEEDNSVSVFYLSETENLSESWKLLGNCSDDESLVKITYQSNKNGLVNLFVPCIEGTWIFNEMNGIETQKIQVTHAGASAEMLLSHPFHWSGSEVDCDPEDPYTWRHEMTDAFGSYECHAIAYCSNGRPYLYSDTVSTQCSY